jgi:hypothetical protein
VNSGSIQGRGDGTVPEVSARGVSPMEDGARLGHPEGVYPPRRLSTSGEHSEIFSNSAVRDFVTENVRYFLQKAASR